MNWPEMSLRCSRRTRRKRNIAYQYRSELDASLLPIDRTYVEMILTNLLSNAFKFTPDGGEITLSVWEENCFGFTVKDTGVGIAPEKLARIFERFYQASEGRKEAEPGPYLIQMPGRKASRKYQCGE